MAKIVVSAGAFVLAAASAASAFTPVNNAVPDRATLGVGTTLSPLDLSALPYLTGSLTTSNSYSQAFAGSGNNFTGTLSVEVFGNVGTPGPGLNDLLMIYTFHGDGAPLIRANGAEGFEFGVDTSVEIDYSDLIAATHGNITGDSSLQAGQLNPAISVNDFISSNDTFNFDYTNAGTVTGRLGELGGNTTSLPGASEDFVWYVRTSGNVAVNFVDVRVTDFGGVTIRSLSLVNNPGQPDINVPAPGIAGALLGFGALAAGRRRR
jgi:hypothetical protein